jgi:predicted RecA/RadA family phage recombinase
MPSTVGSTTAKGPFHIPSDRPHVSALAVVAIKAGQPVKLTTLGKWTPAVAGELYTSYVGVALMDAAAGEECTVAVKGYCVLNALSGGNVDPGPVEYFDQTGATNRARFITSTGVTKTIGYAYDTAVGANVAIRVIMF